MKTGSEGPDPQKSMDRNRLSPIVRRILNYSRPVFAVLAATVAALFAGAARAGEPVALVLEEWGMVTPKVQPYSEIASSTKLRLSRNATLVFLDYNRCMNVTVTGGTVDFISDGYKVEGGRKSQQRVACPGKIAVAHGGEVAGTTLRGMDGGAVVTIPVRPSFAIVGRHRDDFAEVRLSNEGKELARLPLVHHHSNWPAGTQPLTAGTQYELVVVPEDPAATPVELDVEASSSPAASAEALVLIRAD